MIDLAFGVWNVPVLAAAILAGALFGYLAIGYAVRNPLFASGLASPLQNGLLAMFMAIAGGGAFYLSQIAGAYVSGDPLWARVASRFTVWLVFCLAVGLGAFLAAKHDRDVRSQRARARLEQLQHKG